MDMNWTVEEPGALPQTTISELDALCDSYRVQREEIDLLKEQLEGKQGKLREIEAKIVAHLNETRKPNWATPNGLFSVVNRFSVSTPKTPEDKEAFFGYLKEKGIFEEMVTVHSQTLNGFYKQEKEAAIDAGDVDFRIPGIGDPVHTQTISMRKNK